MLRTLTILAPVAAVRAWDVANTPMMGFNTWNLYQCAVDADILTSTAAAMVQTGLKDAGYTYVNSDDCWMSQNRSTNGSQVPDPNKFPQGFKAVADFIHGLGMKAGLYTAKGPHTCQQRAASCNHEAQDAKSWASWGVDYVKDDSCSTCVGNSDMQDYHRMWLGIQSSGRPMVLTVEGSPPADVITHGGYGNAKRVGHDISPNWGSMISLVDIGAGLWPYAHNSQNKTYGGWWNDLDIIEIGNGGGTLGASMYPWAVPATPGQNRSSWTMGADGSVKSGGLCLTAEKPMSMQTCSSTAQGLNSSEEQHFTLEANGNLHLTARKAECLALQDGIGPALAIVTCTQGANEEFTLVDGALCSHALRPPHQRIVGGPKCLTVRKTQPGGGGGGGDPNLYRGGFACAADPAALNRCQVHFTMVSTTKLTRVARASRTVR